MLVFYDIKIAYINDPNLLYLDTDLIAPDPKKFPLIFVISLDFSP